MNRTKEDLINYRIRRAKETIEEAILLSSNNSWNAALNRLYYSAFYVLLALLIKYNFEAKTHNGVRTIFNLKFIKTGIVPMNYGQLFMNLYEKRLTGDYEDFFDSEEDTVIPLIEPTKEFIVFIENLIKSE